MSEPQMCGDFTDWHSEHDFTWDGLNVRHCPGRYAIIPLKPRAAPGSSVPEAARAADEENAIKAVMAAVNQANLYCLSLRDTAHAIIDTARPFIVAAAVAEERATTRQRIEALEAQAAAVRALCDEVEERLPQGFTVALLRTERVRAALASPVENDPSALMGIIDELRALWLLVTR